MTQEDIKKVYVELFFVSLLALYVELFVIRLLSCDIRIFTVFRTFPLITCFVGLGLGMARRKEFAYKLAPLGLFAFLAALCYANELGVCYLGFPSASNFAWQNLAGHLPEGPAVLVLCVAELALLLAGPFFLCYCIGSRIGSLFVQLPTLQAYSVDLLGAVAGSIIFTVFAFLQVPPLVMMSVPVVILFFYVISPCRKNIPLVALLLLALIASPFLLRSKKEQSFPPLISLGKAAVKRQYNTYWSPYQRIDLTTMYVNEPPELLGVEVGVNRAHYQLFLDDDINRAKVNRLVGQLLDERHIQFNFPFVLMPGQRLDDVLIVGAGTGQNVKAACQHGAKHIDAVEIDPVILDIGRRVNPYYHKPEVNLICDDARHFFNISPHKYDLIVFGTLDSHAVAGQGSSVRLDAYVYTEESIRRAMKLLKPDGILFLNFTPMKPWIKYRLYKTFKSVAGPNSLTLRNKDLKVWGCPDMSCICGRPVEKGLLQLSSSWVPADIPKGLFSHPVLTDDWPYLYVEPDVFDWPYMLIVAELVLCALFLAEMFYSSQ